MTTTGNKHTQFLWPSLQWAGVGGRVCMCVWAWGPLCPDSGSTADEQRRSLMFAAVAVSCGGPSTDLGVLGILYIWGSDLPDPSPHSISSMWHMGHCSCGTATEEPRPDTLSAQGTPPNLSEAKPLFCVLQPRPVSAAVGTRPAASAAF